MGLSSDGPDVGKSLAAGGVTGASAPLFLPLNALKAGIAGKIARGGYNSLLAGTTAFGATAITQSGNPDLSGGIGAGSYMWGAAMTTMLPGPMGNVLNQINQILSGPAQNAMTNAGDKARNQ